MKKKTLRLNHFLSSSGVCARRKANELIKKNQVTVNNKRVKNPGLSHSTGSGYGEMGRKAHKAS